LNVPGVVRLGDFMVSVTECNFNRGQNGSSVGDVLFKSVIEPIAALVPLRVEDDRDDVQRRAHGLNVNLPVALVNVSA
jgi:hypothetical protein